MPSLLLGMPSVRTVYLSCSNPPVISPSGGPVCNSISRLVMAVLSSVLFVRLEGNTKRKRSASYSYTMYVNFKCYLRTRPARQISGLVQYSNYSTSTVHVVYCSTVHAPHSVWRTGVVDGRFPSQYHVRRRHNSSLSKSLSN